MKMKSNRSAPALGRSQPQILNGHRWLETVGMNHVAAPRDGRAPARSGKFRRGFLQIDLAVALAILGIAILPLGYSFQRERKALQVEYQRSVLNELVDGEMEILAAGAAKNLSDGSQNLVVKSNAAEKLPLGHFQLTKTGNHLRLEWSADEKCGISPIAREVALK